MPTSIERFREALHDKSADFGVQLTDRDIERLSDYYALLLKWNPRLHLVAPCSPKEFATRHILVSRRGSISGDASQINRVGADALHSPGFCRRSAPETPRNYARAD